MIIKVKGINAHLSLGALALQSIKAKIREDAAANPNDFFDKLLASIVPLVAYYAHLEYCSANLVLPQLTKFDFYDWHGNLRTRQDFEQVHALGMAFVQNQTPEGASDVDNLIKPLFKFLPSK